MPLTTKQTVFFLLFSFYFLLLLLLGESYFGYILLGLGSIFLLSFSSQLDWRQLSKYPLIFLLWLLFILGLILSAVFTSSLPFSIFTLSRMLFLVLVFWFFLLIKKSFISRKQIVESVFLVSLVISIMSILIQFLPSLAQFLPGMNILYATYGHNHIGALLLLILPVSWWIAHKNSQKEHGWWWLLPVWFSTVLLLSFGRVVISIGFVQFLIISKYLKKNGATDIKKIGVLRLIAAFFLIVLIIKAFFSVSFWLNPNFDCPVSPRWEKQICKSFEVESRPHYWYWAVKIFQNNFLFGSGPGTFGIAANKFYLNISTSSAHAHNTFLKAFAEMGLVGGGAFLLLMLGLLIKSWIDNNFRSKLTLSTALLLGVGAIYFNVLFDFDWSFIGVFSLTLIYLALLIKKSGKFKQINHHFLIFYKLIYFSFASLLIVLSGFYLVTEGLIHFERISEAFNLFPYFHWQRKIFETEFSFESPQQNKLLKIYESHPEIYSVFYLKEKDLKRKQLLLDKWIEIDPWQLVSRDIVDYYIQIKDWSAAEERLILVKDFWQWVEKNGNYHIPHLDKMKLADQMWTVAEAYYQRGEVESAAKWYLQAYSINEWILSDYDPIFIKQIPLISDRLNFLNNFTNISSEHYGGHNEIYALVYEEALTDYMENNFSTDEIILHLSNIIKIFPGRKLSLWNQLAPIFNNKIECDLEQGSVKLAQEKTTFLLEIWKLLSDDGNYLDFASNGLDESLLQIIKVTVSNKNYDQLDNYAQFLQVILQMHQTQKKDLVNYFQINADELVQNENFDQAKKIIEMMTLIMLDDYWVMMQPANLALLRGDLENAKEFYQQCLDTYSFRHDDCYYGLKSIDGDYSNPNNYFQVSKIIRGEAIWQDFVK